MIFNSRFLFTLIFAVFISFLSAGCSNIKTIQTYNAGSPPTIDGTPSGWKIEESLLDRSDNFSFNAKLHGDNLYLLIEFRNMFFNESAKLSGFTIYLSNSKDDRRNRGIVFPVGAFNMLREMPGTYRNFVNDPDWVTKPENNQALRELEKEIFNRVMIIERIGREGTNYGFVNLNQLEAQGMNLAFDDHGRFITLEMKIPLDGSAPFQLQPGNVWVGFTIEPPDFRIRDDNMMSSSYDPYYGRGAYGRNPRMASVPRGRSLQQRLGSFDKWFRLRINN